MRNEKVPSFMRSGPMSQSHYETIVCPKCQNTKKFVIWDLVNVSKDPLLSAPLLSGELTTFRCRKCQTETPLARDLLYHDLSRRLAIWLKHSAGDQSALESAAQSLLASLQGDYACRRVASFADLVEKVHLTNDGHSDTSMELVKYGLASRMKLPPTTSLHYVATEIAPTGRKLFVFRSLEANGAREIRSPESDSAEILRDHLRKVDGQTASLGRQWIQVDRAYVAKALGLADGAPPRSKAQDADSIQVFTIGLPPDFSAPHEMDEWIAAGAPTLRTAIWQIGREVSPQEVELHRDRKTGHLYVAFRRVGKNWKRQFVARKVFEELKAQEAAS